MQTHTCSLCWVFILSVFLKYFRERLRHEGDALMTERPTKTKYTGKNLMTVNVIGNDSVYF